MHQSDHAERDRNRDTGGYQGALARIQLDIDRAEEIDAGITGMSTTRQRQIRIETNNRKTGRHEAQDYS